MTQNITGFSNEQQYSSLDDESMTNPDLNLNPPRMQDANILQVTCLPCDVKTKHTAQLAGIPITLAISQEERLTNLVDEYLQHLPEQYNGATYHRTVGNMWYNLELLQTVSENGLNRAENSV